MQNNIRRRWVYLAVGGLGLLVLSGCAAGSALEQARSTAVPISLQHFRVSTPQGGTHLVQGYLIFERTCRCPPRVPCAACPPDFLILGPRPRPHRVHQCPEATCATSEELVLGLQVKLSPRPPPDALCRYVMQERYEEDLAPPGIMRFEVVSWQCP